MTFAELGLSSQTLSALEDLGYETPTPIQEQAIPAALTGQDILGIAQTGTGKTAAFTLPMIDILAKGRARARMPRSLILEPTRELAAQVSENFEKYGKYHKLNMALLIGGVSFGEQEKKLERGADVLIATPGRLLDHFQRGKIMLTGIQMLVIDEADRMLDMGFIPDVERICSLITMRHQTMFFSATMAPEIKHLVDRFLNAPKVIEVSPPASVAETVEQWLVKVNARDKREALRGLLRQREVANAIIFCNRKTEVDILYKSLKRHGFNAGALHGDMDQPKRMEMLADFKSGAVNILVASDVAARGLDIPTVSHVFNFDVPLNADDYVHRIGRTGRAGRKGESFLLSAPSDRKLLAAIIAMLGRELPVFDIPDLAAPEPEAVEEAEEKPRRRTRGGRKPQAGKAEAAPRKTESRPAEKAKSETARPQRAEPREHSPRDHSPRERAPRERAPREDRPVLGLGDHTPDFLLRPVPISKSQ